MKAHFIYMNIRHSTTCELKLTGKLNTHPKLHYCSLLKWVLTFASDLQYFASLTIHLQSFTVHIRGFIRCFQQEGNGFPDRQKYLNWITLSEKNSSRWSNRENINRENINRSHSTCKHLLDCSESFVVFFSVFIFSMTSKVMIVLVLNPVLCSHRSQI